MAAAGFSRRTCRPAGPGDPRRQPSLARFVLYLTARTVCDPVPRHLIDLVAQCLSRCDIQERPPDAVARPASGPTVARWSSPARGLCGGVRENARGWIALYAVFAKARTVFWPLEVGSSSARLRCSSTSADK